MALMTPEVNGARQELPCLDSPKVNGARQEVASVKKYVNGAWQEVWASQKPMSIVEFTDDYSTLSLSADEMQLSWNTYEQTSQTLRVYTAEGEYINPVISFSYYGSRIYFTSDSAQGKYAQAGGLMVVGIQNGTTTTLKSITLGSSSGETNDWLEDFTLNGTFSQIGFYVTTNGGTSAEEVITEINIYDVIIDGKPYKFEI